MDPRFVAALITASCVALAGCKNKDAPRVPEPAPSDSYLDASSLGGRTEPIPAAAQSTSPPEGYAVPGGGTATAPPRGALPR